MKSEDLQCALLEIFYFLRHSFQRRTTHIEVRVLVIRESQTEEVLCKSSWYGPHIPVYVSQLVPEMLQTCWRVVSATGFEFWTQCSRRTPHAGLEGGGPFFSKLYLTFFLELGSYSWPFVFLVLFYPRASSSVLVIVVLFCRLCVFECVAPA